MKLNYMTLNYLTKKIGNDPRFFFKKESQNKN